METLSTQSNGSPIGRLSRILPARSRMIGARVCRLAGDTAGLTVLRWASCLGGSMAMNMKPPSGFGSPAMLMPPYRVSEENTA